MITKPTLFILGAGASIPYGFPSGWELRNQICALGLNDGALVSRALTKHFNINQDELHAFTNTFLHSRIASIDAFLSRRTEFSDIGKLVIASLLVPVEREDKFNSSISDDWYFALWNALVSNVSSINGLASNQIRIFTFNYDRSLESYLHTAIINTFKVNPSEALNALKYFNITHVYGSLGEFGIANEFSAGIRAYSHLYSKESVGVAAKFIRVIPEARSEDSVFHDAKEAFLWAENVCFLGFGFDPLNVERLGFSRTSSSLSGELSHVYVSKNVVTSAFGKTESQMQIAHSSLFDSSSHSGVPKWFHINTLKNLETLDHFAWLLT